MKSIVCLVSIFTAAATVNAIYPDRPAYNPAFPTVGRCINLGTTAGSGVVISSRHVLTAKHVSGTPANAASMMFQLGSNNPLDPTDSPDPVQVTKSTTLIRRLAPFGSTRLISISLSWSLHQTLFQNGVLFRRQFRQ